MKFRYHRGTLEESLKTEIELNSIQELSYELFDYCCNHLLFKLEKYKIKFYVYDKRVNKNLYIVLIEENNFKIWIPVGFVYDSLSLTKDLTQLIELKNSEIVEIEYKTKIK